MSTFGTAHGKLQQWTALQTFERTTDPMNTHPQHPSQHSLLPTFANGKQAQVKAQDGKTIAPPYLIRTLHPTAGGPIIRHATRAEIRQQDRRLTFMPIFFLFAGKWVKLTPRGIWAATDGLCRYRLLENTNGDIVGIGLY